MEGRAPAWRIVDDGPAVAFLDVRPLFPGHTLVVPRVHRAEFRDLERAELEPLVFVAQRVSNALGRALGSEGTFVALNDRVSQSVAHVHLHVVPRRRKDGLRGFFWPRHRYATDEEAEAIAERIRAALA